MNPFQLQADLFRQWLTIAGSVGESTSRFYAAAGRDAVEAWTRVLTPAPSFRAWSPAAPWAAYAQWLAPAPAGTALFSPYAAPFALAWSSAALAPFASFAHLPWLWPFGAAAMMSGFPGALHRRDPTAELIEQVATAYRTANGFAVATVLTPFAAPLAPRSDGRPPWWQAPYGRLPGT